MMPGPDTIAEILQGNAEFSMFTEALQFANVFNFLNMVEGVSRTVFAPTDEAFSMQIPEDLFDCLKNYMRVPLNNLVLYHIARSAEYVSALSVRMGTFTLFVDGYNTVQHIPITSDGNGTILLGQTDPRAMIITPDIPASNGVLHVIDRVLIPPNFDYGMCQALVPTTPPPTTPPPTTMPPTTMAPTTLAPTAAPLLSGDGELQIIDEKEENEDDYKIDYENNP